MRSSMAFSQPMNSEDFASNFSTAWEASEEPSGMGPATVTEPAPFVGNLGRYVQVRILS